MKPWKLGALLALAIATAGCSGCTLQSPDTLTLASRTTIDEKVVLAAEVAYGLALDKVIELSEDGTIHGARATQILAVIEQAKALRPVLHKALETANQTELLAQLNGLKELTAQLRGLAAEAKGS